MENDIKENEEINENKVNEENKENKEIKANEEVKDNKENKVNNNKPLIIVIIILVICVLGLSGYIIYDKFLSDNTKTNENENNTQNNDENKNDTQNNDDNNSQNNNNNNSENNNENESDSNNNDEKLDINSSIANELKSKILNGFYNERYLIKKNNEYEYSDVYKVHYAIAKLIKDNNYIEKKVDYKNTKVFSLENVEKVINDNFSNNSITDIKIFYDDNMGGGELVYENYTNPYSYIVIYDEQEKSFYYDIVPTGGMNPRVYPLYQFDFIDIEKKDNYYYLTANVLLYSEGQDEYKCAFEAPSSRYELSVYADIDKKNLIYEKVLEVPCSEDFDEYVKNNIKTSEYASKASKYRFKFTSDKKFVSIEKI